MKHFVDPLEALGLIQSETLVLDFSYDDINMLNCMYSNTYDSVVVMFRHAEL